MVLCVVVLSGMVVVYMMMVLCVMVLPCVVCGGADVGGDAVQGCAAMHDGQLVMAGPLHLQGGPHATFQQEGK